ncbi:Esterase/lipase superfamily enzyme [Aliiroseovarius halocynthiae]|uniref:Alpha/beta fold hydrolase n=1 Tax=Aliiroseovarius halocynthiae TaxID=985055 RepID=A0A545SNQ6_9RHOB|nr:alpha/beta fold hydrolase [Aliiroseovarius halocynthiae]TQV66609.1 alpha/beta fold hydrolase [Aliiroseovarius halocynthiae]SMR82517.1 Esterase/lipase superfamily enzyme [Aliiroseovarius halocynthiae]
MRRFVFLVVLVLSACAPRGTITFLPGAGQIGDVQSIFVTSTRETDENGAPTSNRGGDLLFGEVSVSIPKQREPGEINWPGRKTPDPAKHFLVDSYERYPSQRAFETAMSRALRGRRGEERTAAVFVHGFNNRFSEGLYRFAQLNADLELPFLPVHYSWPSAGHPLGYGYDRDSMLFARDGLEATLRSVSKSGVDEILLVGHSMGALLSMEALRQMAIADGQKGLSKIGGVVLISPDIDLDLFRQQAKRIGKLPQPFYIFTSSRDRALKLSAGLTGQNARLGNNTDVAELAELDVTLVDLSAFSDGQADHNVAFASPAFLRLINSIPNLSTAISDSPTVRPGLLPGTVLVVQNATRLVIPNTSP